MEIRSEAGLRELLGVPNARAAGKDRARLAETDRQWLAASSFCVLATADAAGHCDASPKGDPAGQLIHVLDDVTVAIAERPGNRRADGYLNILANPHVGILSFIPGRNDTRRINGRARLVDDAPFFDDMTTRGQRPILAIVVDIEQVFYHCPKAGLRSELWQPAAWQPDALPGPAAIVKAVQDTPETLEELDAYYAPDHYATLLY
jgi:uncharacterized protein